MKITVIFHDPCLESIVVEGANADYRCEGDWVVVTSDRYSETPKKRYTFPSCIILYIIEEND